MPPSPSNMTEAVEKLLAMRIQSYNEAREEHGSGLPDCPDCKGKGFIAFAQDGNMVVRYCKCASEVKSRRRAQKAGLASLYDLYTLDTYTTSTPWQARLKEKAEAYIAGKRGWFFLCGRSGSGKSHLTCAIARALIREGMAARYLMWRSDAPRLKAILRDQTDLEALREFTDAELLIIDDLWKGRTVTDADINLTFELLNRRYNNLNALTLISTEKTLDEIIDIDEAIAGRIRERARGFTLKTADVNLRLG